MDYHQRGEYAGVWTALKNLLRTLCIIACYLPDTYFILILHLFVVYGAGFTIKLLWHLSPKRWLETRTSEARAVINAALALTISTIKLNHWVTTVHSKHSIQKWMEIPLQEINLFQSYSFFKPQRVRLNHFRLSIFARNGDRYLDNLSPSASVPWV